MCSIARVIQHLFAFGPPSQEFADFYQLTLSLFIQR